MYTQHKNIIIGIIIGIILSSVGMTGCIQIIDNGVEKVKNTAKKYSNKE